MTEDAPTFKLRIRLHDLVGLPHQTDVVAHLDGLSDLGVVSSSNPSSDGNFLWPGEEALDALYIDLEKNDALCHRLCAPASLRLRLTDGAQEIGTATWDLSDFLHNCAGADGSVTVCLSEAWDAKWDEPVGEDEAAKEKVETTISYEISIDSLIAPDSDREMWSVLSLTLGPCLGIQDELATNKFALWCLGYEHNGTVEEREKIGDEDEKITERVLSWSQTYHWYCGKEFLLRLNDALNHTGGTWVFLVPEEKEDQQSKAWLDLRPFLTPGTTKTVQEISLSPSEVSLPLEMEIRFPVVELPPPIPHPKALITRRKDVQKFPHSHDATLELIDGVERAIVTFATGYSVHGDGNSGEFSASAWKDAMESLWAPVHKVFREKFRKSVGIVKDPTKPFEGEERNVFVAEVLTDISNIMVDVMQQHKLVYEDEKLKNARRVVWQQSRDHETRCQRLAREAEISSNWDRALKMHHTILILEGSEESKLGAWTNYGLFLLRMHGRDFAAEEALLESMRIAEKYDLINSEEYENSTYAVLCLLLQRGRYDAYAARLDAIHNKKRSSTRTNLMQAMLFFLRGQTDVAAKFMQLAIKPDEFFRTLKDQKAIFEKLRLYTEIGDRGSSLASESGVGGVDLDAIGGVYDELTYLLYLGFPKLVFTVLDAPELNFDITKHEARFKVAEAAAYFSQRDYGTLIETLEESGRWIDESDCGCFKFEFERLHYIGECYFQTRQFDKARIALSQAAQPEIVEMYPDILIRLGHCHLLRKEWSMASEYFQKSLHIETTAESWVGIAFAAYRCDQLDLCYEALREALWLDRERCDVWAFLTLVHIRNRNDELYEICFRETLAFSEQGGDELLLEIGIQLLKTPRSGVAELAEVAARTALRIRETGQAHEVLADSLAMQELHEKAILESGVAIRLLYDKPKHRERIVSKALEWSEFLNDPPLAESVHIADKLASLKYEETKSKDAKGMK